MDPCKNLEPQVINHNMIERCLEEQGLKGELGRLAREEGIPWNEVTHIRLEFRNILRIDHIWVLPALTMLSLSHNLVENIENLQTLVNLVELDLSFNKITKIENLESLVNLEILSLFNNKIERIENMDSLTKLLIFSIGNNEIADRNNVLYLRSFKRLKSVNMAGNPCAEEEDFRIFVATFLPKLVYYEYKMIEPSEREEGQIAYAKKLTDLEAAESDLVEAQEKLEAERHEAELHSESFVEFLGTNHLFLQMFENDSDGKVLLKMGDEAKDYYVEFETAFVALSLQIFENGQEMYKARRNEVDEFRGVSIKAKSQNQENSINEMEKFLKVKEDIFKEVANEKESTIGQGKDSLQAAYHKEVGVLRTRYLDEIHKTWKKLMGLEMSLFDQLEELNQTFELVVTEMINSFIEMAQGLFSQMRSAQTTYHEQISDMATRIITVGVVTPELQQVFVDRDTLNSALAGSNDLHLLVIDDREDRLVRRAKSWLNTILSDLQKNEIARSRAKVLEICHYLDIQKEDFEEFSLIQDSNTDVM